MIRPSELFSADWREVREDHDPPSGVGVVYTKPEIASWMLDLVGYTPSANLTTLRLLDPGCGAGAFTLEAIRRLAEIVRTNGKDWSNPGLIEAIAAVDIDAAVLNQTRCAARTILEKAGCPLARAESLTQGWFIHSDFLLMERCGKAFDIIIGNPPYVRLEDLPKRLLAIYRNRYETATERADLYIPFFEAALDLLSPSGQLAYLCANRFAKNKYGAALRRLIAQRHHVRAYLNLEHTEPFEGKVAAYPAIVILDNDREKPTAVAELSDISATTRQAVTLAMRTALSRDAVHHFDRWHADGSPWILTRAGDARHHDELSRLPLLEDSAPGTRVGIGVATGADRVFIRSTIPAGVEAGALLPLAEADDIRSGRLNGSHRWLLNPYREDGTLRDDTDAPGLMRALREHEERLRARHCAKKTPARWYRTIDRIWPQWVTMPKLLLPDIQSGGVVAHDPGRFYPHHNVYWIASRGWNLHALQTLMRSDAVTRQIRAHSVQMRGGAIRYQTQTLRKLRLPAADSISPALLDRLASLAESSDLAAVNAAANEAFSIS